MSTIVDNYVAKMLFDNTGFENGVSKTLSSLSKLKDSLNLSGAVKGTDEIASSINRMDFADMSKALDNISEKFSALGILGVEVLSRIANKAIDAGEKFVKSMAIDPISQGWDKYAQKTTAVQTIMAATADQFEDTGTQMEYVNGQLEKLNWYTDETSYNFVDMVGNIGKFTSNGIALDEAVTSMQGIANWAAISGQNAATASRAMYNLAQAIGVGSVKLMDWRSIENANMSTKEFKQTALDTAVSVGTLTKEAENLYKTIEDGTEVTIETFSSTLSKGWFSKEVLTTALDKYGAVTNKLYELADSADTTATEILQLVESEKKGTLSTEDLVDAMGGDSTHSVESFRKAIQELASKENEFGLKAFRAAQEAKTFQDAIDATKDAVSTGWMNTFEIIFGNYEKAKTLWTKFAEDLYTIFAEGGEKRNALLKTWGSSNWEKLAKKISSAGVSLGDFEDKLSSVLKSHGVAVDKLVEEYGSIGAAIESGAIKANTLSAAIRSVISQLINGKGAVTGITGDAKSKIEEVQQIVNDIWNGKYGNGSERKEALEALGLNYEYFQNLVAKGSSYKVTLEDIDDEMLRSVGITDEEIALLREVGEDYELLGDLTGKSGRDIFINSLSNAMQNLIDLLDIVKGAWTDVFGEITTDTLLNITQKFSDVIDSLALVDKKTGELTDLGETVQTIVSSVFSYIESIRDVFSGVWGIFKKAASGASPLLSSIVKLATNIVDLFTSINKRIAQLLGNVKELKVWNTLCSWLAKIVDKISSKVNSLKKKIDSPEFEKKITKWSTVLEFVQQKLGEILTKVTSIFDAIDLAGVWAWLQEIWGGLKDALSLDIFGGDTIEKEYSTISDRFKAWIKEAWNSFSDFLGKAWEAIKNFAKGIWDKLSLDKISLFNAGKLAIAIKWIKNAFTKSVGNELGGMIAEISSILETLPNAIQRLLGLKGIKAKGALLSNLGEAMLNLGKGALFLAGALLILSAIKPEKLASALKTFLTVMGITMATVIILGGMADSIGRFKLAEAAASVLLFSAAMAVLAATLGMFSIIANLDEEGKGLEAFISVLVVAGVAMIALSSIVSLTGGMKMIAAASSMLIFASAVVVLAGALALFALVGNLDKEAAGLSAFIQVLVIATVALSALALINFSPANMLSAAAALLIFATAVGIMAVALGALVIVTTLCKTDMYDVVVSMALALGALAVILAVLAPLGPSLLVVAGALLLAAAACVVLAIALAALGLALIPIGIGIEALGKGLGAGIGAVFELILDGIADGILAIDTAIAAGSELIGIGIGTGFESIGTGISNAITNVSNAISTGSTTISAAVSVAITTVTTSLSDGITSVSTSLSVGIDLVSVAISEGSLLISGGVSSAIEEISLAISDGSTVISTGVSTAITTISTSISDGVTLISTSITTGITGISTAIKEGIDSVSTSLSEGIVSVSESIEILTTSLSGIGTSLTDIGLGLTDFGVGVKSLDGISWVTTASGLNSMRKSLVDMKKIAPPDDYSGTFGEFISNLGSSFSKLGPGLLALEGISWEVTSDGLASLSKGLKKIEKIEFADVDGVISYIEAIVKLADLGTTFETTAESLATGFRNVGDNLGKSLIAGITANKIAIKNAAVSITQNAINAVQGYTRSCYSVGYNLVAGMTSGVYSGSGMLSAACRYVVQCAISAARATAKVHSPSRVFMKIGEYFTEGLAIGIRNNSSLAENSASNVVKNTISAVTKTADAVASAVNDSSLRPVISPVIDLTSVRKGASEIDSMLSITTALDLGVNINNLFGRIQNAGSEPAKVVAELDPTAIRAIAGKISIDPKFDINVNYEGSLSQLANILYPYMTAESTRIGKSLVH